MKKLIFLISISCFTLTSFSQDIIVRKNKERIKCRITSIDSTKICFDIDKNNETLSTWISKNEVQYYQSGEEGDFLARNYLSDVGDHLIRYSRTYYFGFAMIVTGYTITLSSAIIESEELMMIGGFIAISGGVLQIISHNFIGKAGRILKDHNLSFINRIKLNPSIGGISLAYKF